jgi:excisionase family DNA binding protein
MRMIDMVQAEQERPSAGPAGQLLTIDEVSARMRLHRSRVYGLLSTGALRSVKIGKSRRVPVAEIERYIARLLEEQSDPVSA